MRIFGRSAAGVGASASATSRRAQPVSEAAELVELIAAEPEPVLDLAVTDEMPTLREVPSVYPSLAPDVVESTIGEGEDGDSDVFVCRRSSPDLAVASA